jgi:hypothetical protein
VKRIRFPERSCCGCTGVDCTAEISARDTGVISFFSLMIIAGPGAQKKTKKKDIPLRLTRDKPGNKIKET